MAVHSGNSQAIDSISQEAGKTSLLPDAITSRLIPSSFEAARCNSDEEASGPIIDELQSEIVALRRELRLLRVANSELERVAIRDTLTPLFNRRYFLSTLQDQLARTRRYGASTALLFIDVNRMKYINDRFGHGAGDYALMHVADIVESHIRATDIAARIGGDEFAMILESVDEESAVAKAKQLSDMLRATPCIFGATTLPVSASIGLTLLRPNDTPESLMDRADADMYARKRKWYEHRARQHNQGKTQHLSA